MSEKIKVTIWNENLHEHHAEGGLPFYPDGIHNYIKGFLSKDAGLEIRTATIQEPEHGLTDEVLNDTDVLDSGGLLGAFLTGFLASLAGQAPGKDVLEQLRLDGIGGTGCKQQCQSRFYYSSCFHNIIKTSETLTEKLCGTSADSSDSEGEKKPVRLIFLRFFYRSYKIICGFLLKTGK